MILHKTTTVITSKTAYSENIFGYITLQS